MHGRQTAGYPADVKAKVRTSVLIATSGPCSPVNGKFHCLQALVRMHKRSWEPASSGGTTSSPGSPSIQATAAMPAAAAAPYQAPSYQRSQLSVWPSGIALDGRIGGRVCTSGNSISDVSDVPELRAQPRMSDGNCDVVADLKTDTVSRADSLEQLLEASCHGMAGVLLEDMSAADQRVQQHSMQAGRQQESIANDPAADGERRLSAAAETAGTLQPDTGNAASDAVGGPAAAEQDMQSGASRRNTDTSVSAENTALRQELSRLRSEHVTTRIQCACYCNTLIVT